LDFAIAQATTNAERTEQLAEISKAKIAALETQLRQTEEIVRGKESTIKSLQQALQPKCRTSISKSMISSPDCAIVTPFCFAAFRLITN